jgi:2-polyprenyl-3-methyl-5-hydroxy-6-metoxy-1,4-benzoquinol methylase
MQQNHNSLNLKHAEGHYRLAINRINRYAREVYPRKILMLEVGAGHKIIEKFLEKNVIYHTLDIEEQEHNSRFRYTYNFNLDNPRFPIENNKYDIVLCNETLEHCAYPRIVVKEIKRVAKMEALFFFSVPNEYNFVLRMYYLLGHKTPSHTAFDIVEEHKHIQLPRVKDTFEFFDKMGFNVTEIDYIWESWHGGHSRLLLFIDDKIINNILAKIYPSLFARTVVLYLRNKK